MTPLPPKEGWHVLHLFYHIDCSQCAILGDDGIGQAKVRYTELNQEIRDLIDLVKTQGKTYRVRPLNAYYRRLAYNVIAADEAVVASSPPGDDRLKRISISLKTK
jgi:hypothetical protein